MKEWDKRSSYCNPEFFPDSPESPEIEESKVFSTVLYGIVYVQVRTGLGPFEFL